MVGAGRSLILRQLSCTLLFSLLKKHFSAVFSPQVLAYTLSCVCTSAFSAGIIEAAEAEDIMNKLRLLVENHQQVRMCALILSLWVLCCREVLVLAYSN